MCGGVLGPDLVARVGRDEMPAVLQRRHVRPMDFTGRPLAGFVYVAPEGVRRAADLRAWLDRGLRVAAAAGPKRPVPKRIATGRGRSSGSATRGSSHNWAGPKTPPSARMTRVWCLHRRGVCSTTRPP